MSEIPATIGDRATFFQMLQQYVTDYEANASGFALLLIEISNFRSFNTRYGHQLGDTLLCAFTEKLKQQVRDQDYVGRTGSAEFAVLIPAIKNAGLAQLAAVKISTALNSALDVNGESVQIQANVGVTLCPQHAANSEQLFRYAEFAMIDSRRDESHYAIFSLSGQSENELTWEIESDLKQAIDRDEFELYLQPQVYLGNGKLFGAEALIRWKNADKGFISPGIFIPVAEKTGQIYEITNWTVNAAMWLRKSWPENLASIPISVNISTRVLSDPDFNDCVLRAFSIYGIDYSQLTLEITESALVEDQTTAFQKLHELKKLGINISIDDFGTGFSSLEYFKNIPASELKIDQSFIKHMLDNAKDQHIVKTIIQMANGFGLKVVAEGIEDEKTFEALRNLGCDIAQGYHLSKPMAAGKFIEWLDANQLLET